MTQIEIAKKILEQGSCGGVKCYDDNCPFVDTVCDTTDKQKWIEKIKQWLKKQEKKMIDLTKEQILTEPVKCWVEHAPMVIIQGWLVKIAYISGVLKYATINGVRHESEPTVAKSAINGVSWYTNCTLIDPTKPKFKPWLKVEDVPVGIWLKALCKHKGRPNTEAYPLSPYGSINSDGCIYEDLVYLPLGQPLTGEWLEMGEWV